MTKLLETLSKHPNMHGYEDNLIPAHFNKSELAALDRAQGGADIDHKTGARRYSKLGEMLKNPHLREKSLEHGRLLFAKGGKASVEKMKKEGRFGDTEIAYIPKHLADHFDEMIGGPSINPKTKNREYFFGALIGAGMAAARAAAPLAIRAASTAARYIPKAASTAARYGARAAGTAAKYGARAAGTAAKYGARAAGTAAKYGAKALPYAKSFAQGAMKVAPDVLNGWAQYEQEKQRAQSQKQMMDMIGSLAQNQGGGYMYPPMQEPQQFESYPSFYNPPPSDSYNQNYGSYGPPPMMMQQPQQSMMPNYYQNNQYGFPYQQEFAEGGSVRKEIENLKKKGRCGDTEVAFIPKNLQDHLDEERGETSINPDTGHHEYFLPLLLAGASAIPALIDLFSPQPQAPVRLNSMEKLSQMRANEDPKLRARGERQKARREAKYAAMSKTPEAKAKRRERILNRQRSLFENDPQEYYRQKQKDESLWGGKEHEGSYPMNPFEVNEEGSENPKNSPPQDMGQQNAPQQPMYQSNPYQQNQYGPPPFQQGMYQQRQSQPRSYQPNSYQQGMYQQNQYQQPYFNNGRAQYAEGGPSSINDLHYLEENTPPRTDEEEYGERSPMIVVHMSEDELLELDRLQGGESIDPGTGFREYSKLEEVLKIPEIRKLFDELAAEFELSGHEDPYVDALENDLQEEQKKYNPSPSDFEPEVLETEAHGVDGDNELALIPLSVADYFDELRGFTDYNEDGLRQYGWFKELIRVGATIAGAVLGGPVGAGVGAAAGNYLTGASAENSLKRGLGVGSVAGLGGAAAGAVAPGFMASNPTIAGMLGQGAGGAFGGLGTMFGGAANPAASTASTGNVVKDILLKDSAKQAAGSSSLLGGLGDILKNPMTPLLAGGAMMMMGARQSAKEKARVEEEQRRKLDDLRKYYGIQSRGPTINPNSFRRSNPEIPSYYDQAAGREHMSYIDTPYQYQYAQGGSIDHPAMEPGEEYVTDFTYLDGDTKGQDDEKKINLPKGAYVTDASFTSMLGDGNSKAGAKKVKEITDVLLKKAKNIPNLEVPQGRVPALLSDGEAVIPPEAISALGDGNNTKGANRMKKAIEATRKFKSKNGKGLPPKMPPLHKIFASNSELKKDLKKVGRDA